MEAWKVETQKKKVIYQERKKMFKDGRDYNGSRKYKPCSLYSLEWIQINLKI